MRGARGARRGVSGTQHLVLVADAGPPFAPTSGVALLAEERVEVDRELEGVGERNVRILALT
jgi:hypothetical protein